MWGSGSNSSYENWGFGEPDGGVGENCAIIDTSDTRRNWNDKPCTQKHKVICEKGKPSLFIYGVETVCVEIIRLNHLNH